MAENIAIHKTAEVEKGAILKGTIIIGPNSRIGEYAYLRGSIIISDLSILGHAPKSSSLSY